MNFTTTTEPGQIIQRSPLDILIIDDHEEMRRALELALGHMGNICFSAKSFSSARATLSTFVIDLIICDLHLPDGNAIELFPTLPQAYRHIPSVLITADNDPFIIRRSRDAGYRACLRKPLEMEELMDTIATVLD
jgi:DNA-binding NarL/FixJ family response regulator